MSWVLAAWIGCVEPVGTSSPGSTREVVPVDTGPTGLIGQFGAITVGERASDGVDEPYTYARGYFVSRDGGVDNYGACAFWPTHPCVLDYPAEGQTVEAAALSDLEALNTATYFDVGPVYVGDLVLRRSLREDGPIHFVTLGFEVPTAPGRLSLGRDFAFYNGVDDFVPADPMVLQSPDPVDGLRFGPGVDEVTLAWETPAQGDVLLEIGTQVTHLADDGRHVLSATELGLAAPLSGLEISLGRMTLREVDAAGNTIRLQSRRDQPLHAMYVDFTDYLALGDELYESCSEALGNEPLPPGRYHGDLSTYEDDHRARARPGRPLETPGGDVALPFRLAAGEELTLTYRSARGGVVTLLSADCANPRVAPGIDELTHTIRYRAAKGEELVLLVDNRYLDLPGSELFTVEWSLQSPEKP